MCEGSHQCDAQHAEKGIGAIAQADASRTPPAALEVTCIDGIGRQQQSSGSDQTQDEVKPKMRRETMHKHQLHLLVGGKNRSKARSNHRTCDRNKIRSRNVVRNKPIGSMTPARREKCR